MGGRGEREEEEREKGGGRERGGGQEDIQEEEEREMGREKGYSRMKRGVTCLYTVFVILFIY